MSTIHFLNVKDGDCSLIEHNSGNITVIDVCNAKQDPLRDFIFSEQDTQERGIGGNYQQKKYPVNPISYMQAQNINRIFRYIQTHPDMDHMDGIKELFHNFNPLNFWDTNNTKEIPGSKWQGSHYSEDDWLFYKNLRDSDPDSGPKRLTLYSCTRGQYYNRDVNNNTGGDGLYAIAPTKELVAEANEVDEDYNRCSYVILYLTNNGSRVVFGGDSHDETWEYIISEHKQDVTNVDLLIAPHHGRKSNRSYEFLDILNPSLTFFGNARHEYLAYDAWYNRDLPIITNNQANCMIVDTNTMPMSLYVTHENFARRCNPTTYYNYDFKSWYVCSITKNQVPF